MMTLKVKCTSELTRKSAQIEMLPDTGSEVTAADRAFVKKLGMSLNNLSPSDITPMAADARNVGVLGKMNVNLELNDRKSEEEIYIFRSSSGPILSQMACKRLGIVHPEFPLPLGSLKKSDKIEQHETADKPLKPALKENLDSQLTKEGLIAEFPGDFDGAIRSIPGEKYQIKMTKEVKPVCMNTPRVVPLPLKVKLKKEKDQNGSYTAVCGRCGYEHTKERCPARDKICYNCKKKGHFALWCKTLAQDYGSLIGGVNMSQKKEKERKKPKVNIAQNYKAQKAPLIQKSRLQRPFQEITLIYTEKDGHKFLIVIDCKTEWPDIIQCINGDTLIKELRSIFCRHAVPDLIWTDDGPQFTSGLLQDFLKAWGVKQILNSPRNPLSNRKVEATVKSMKNIISSALTGRGVDEEKLARALLQYRNTQNKRDGLSPEQKLYGRQIQDTLLVHRRLLRENKALPHDRKIRGRRYLIKTGLTRNKKNLRARLPYDPDKHNDSNAIENLESGAAKGMMNPQQNPNTEGALRLFRPRRKPECLIEDEIGTRHKVKQ